MAKEVQVLTTCDLHEGEVEASLTKTFVFDGNTYEVDLCDEHRSEVDKMFARLIESGRKLETPQRVTRRRASTSPSSGSTVASKIVKAWGEQHGWPGLSSRRGRLPAALQEAYEKDDPSIVPSLYEQAKAS